MSVMLISLEAKITQHFVFWNIFFEFEETIEKDSKEQVISCYCSHIGVMAVYVKAIPTLRGTVADRFEKISDENIRRRVAISFSKDAANSYVILRTKSVKL